MVVEKSILFFVITYWMNINVILLFSASIITLLCHSSLVLSSWRRKVGGDALLQKDDAHDMSSNTCVKFCPLCIFTVFHIRNQYELAMKASHQRFNEHCSTLTLTMH